MLGGPGKGFVGAADVAIPATVDQRMQPGLPQVPIHEQGLMGVVADRAFGFLILHPHEPQVLGGLDLAEIPGPAGQLLVADQAGFTPRRPDDYALALGSTWAWASLACRATTSSWQSAQVCRPR
jgi:hypothetical protein